MKIISILTRTLLTFTFITLISTTSTYAQDSKFDAQKIDSYIESEMKKNLIPGMSLGIVKNNEILHLKGYGKDHNGKEITPQTSFLLASVSKPITGSAIMNLQDKGLLSIEDTVKKHIPWFELKDKELSSQITIKQLLNHTSGIPTDSYSIEKDTSLTDHVKSLNNIQLDSKPGDKYQYSSTNYQILGVVIESISGKSYGDYMQENIFAPLEMNNTFTSQEKALENEMTKGHQYWFGKPRPSKLTYPENGAPNGFIISSAEDMTHFLKMSLNEGKYNDKQLISSENIKQMFTPSAKITEKTSIGLSWRIGPVNEIPAYWHGGTWQDFLSEMVIMPETGHGIILTSNAATMFDNDMSGRIVTGVMNILLDKPVAPSEGGKVKVIYKFLNIGIVLILLNELFNIYKLRKYKNKVLQYVGDKKLIFRKIYLPLIIDILMPFIIIGALFYFGMPITLLPMVMPDIAIVVGILFLLGVLEAIFKSFIVYRVQFQKTY